MYKNDIKNDEANQDNCQQWLSLHPAELTFVVVRTNVHVFKNFSDLYDTFFAYTERILTQ